MLSPSAVPLLHDALRSVLKEQFEEEIRAQIEREPWYSEFLPVDELFRLWVVDNVMSGAPPQWVFEPIRARERLYLCDELGISREEITHLPPRRVAGLVLQAVGLPVVEVHGRAEEEDRWKSASELILADEDERASVMLRQLAERLLRKVLYFHCLTGLEAQFLNVLANPGSLRVPAVLAAVLDHQESERGSALSAALVADGWSTLGFLNIALRKLSRRAVEAGIRDLTGREFVLFEQDDHDAFERLTQGLQAYTHDKPSVQEDRADRLSLAVEGCRAALARMIARNIVPDELMVLESGLTVHGGVFRGAGSQRRVITVATRNGRPQCGRRVLFTVSANCDFAAGKWTESPWSPL